NLELRAIARRSIRGERGICCGTVLVDRSAGAQSCRESKAMTHREGSLEAPTRHAIDWRNPEYYDEASLNRELERIFEICHGCRRCVSLCNAFPTLFDLVDATRSGE